MTKIAVLGYGVVGSGTVEVFCENKERLKQKTGLDLEISYILDKRDFPDSPYKDKFVKDYSVILADPEVEIVAELIGGNTVAYDFVKQALQSGKSVVTSNKELVATKGAELLRLAREHSVSFLFEASVGGGIPVIKPLHECLGTDSVEEISGILNGTTNFILTQMIHESTPFAEALETAQRLGYAERDPSDDIDGHDTCRKICILASLAFGKHIYPEFVRTEGIREITLQDVAYAESAGYSVKLVGHARRVDERTEVAVCPMLVRSDSILGGVNDVFNAVMIRGAATGEVLFYGRGAGKYPTASAVISDIVSAAKACETSRSLTWVDGGRDDVQPDGAGRYYIRVKKPAEGAIARAFGEVEELSAAGFSGEECAFLAGAYTEAQLSAALEGFDVLGRIRVLDLQQERGKS